MSCLRLRHSWSVPARLLWVVPVLFFTLVSPGRASDIPEPDSVTIAGSLQSELGCPGDWQPDCAATGLAFDDEDAVWQAVFDLPAGDWEYKAPLNGTWDVNFGADATRDGANIALSLTEPAPVKFYYPNDSHWVTDSATSVIATAPGNYQTELGCNNDWDPSCLRAWLQDPDGDGILTFSARLPAGSYEVKAALNENWDVNFGRNGERDGANIPFSVPASDHPEGAEVFFSFDPDTGLLSVTLEGGAGPAPTEPDSVTIAGSMQSELGCPDDWQPDCAATGLAFDDEDGVWQNVFDVPAGDWEYKAPLNGTWEVNFGADATQDGPNIGLSLADPAAVKFYYSNRTNWVTDNHNRPIAVAAGSFQSEIGCNGDWDPACLRSWLQDADGDGIFSFSARLPAGDFETKVAVNENWDVNFGEGGVRNGANIAFSVPAASDPAGTEVFFFYDGNTNVLTIALGDLKGDLRRSRAHWLDADTIAWNPAELPDGSTVRLHSAADAGLSLSPEGVDGGEAFELVPAPEGLSPELAARFPHLDGLQTFRLEGVTDTRRRELLTGQIAVSAVAADGASLDATGVQIPGVLDDLFGYDGPLGAAVDADGVTLRVWAPTAKSVDLLLFDGPGATAPADTHPMRFDAATGVWSVSGPADWDRRYFLYEVEVYAPATRRIETNRATDPYSLSLAADSRLSQIVDLSDPDLKPAGWDSLAKPRLARPEDIALYELHVRDFSIADDSVPAVDRGRLTAFTRSEAAGMAHLAGLAEAGLTHVHILPAFDFATVPERAADRLAPAGDLAAYPADSDRQQAAIAAVKDQDGFNWGYDPWHYTVPEGSYATDPDGVQRIREFRAMVQALNRAGLRVVMDVVYNHTTAAGQNARSVLDRIVPGYYHRLNADGFIETSSCCPNTASEHAMMEKLLIDSALIWAADYKVDGFRFDLMGHHMKSNIVELRRRLDAMTIENDGIDGEAVYIYGEGWNFGEVADNARGINAIQRNMAGTGVGTFNDRMRDGLRGGSAFGALRAQGFATGLFTAPNDTDQGDQLDGLMQVADWVRIGLAGTLADYEFVNADGQRVRADQVDYFGQQAGYTADPQEVINMAAAHDNETLFDAIQLKASSSTPLAERIRMQWLGNSLVALAQGVPFFHAGQEMLRSKSMDRDSFNSGDWFNALDYSLETGNWGRGLPSAEKNADNWPIMAPLLADPALKPAALDREATVVQFEEMLKIRSSSPLFRLANAGEIRNRLEFANTGPDQIPGLIVMRLSDAEGTLDRRHVRIVTLFNTRPEAVTFPAGGDSFELHPVQRDSGDARVRQSRFDADSSRFDVPARTTAVFVQPRPLRQRLELLLEDIQALADTGMINAGQARSLSVKLSGAIGRLRVTRETAAAGMVAAFVEQAEALGLDRALIDEAADIAETLAERLPG